MTLGALASVARLPSLARLSAAGLSAPGTLLFLRRARIALIARRLIPTCGAPACLAA